jgi:tetratricopeptide (TPR) repeat protein
VLIPNYQLIVAVIATLYFVRTASYTLAYEDDIKLFNANIRNQRKSVEAHINLGDRWNVQHNRPDIALPLFQKAVELDPKSDLGWFNLGVAQHNLGLYEEAIKSWEKAIEVNPSYVNPRYNLIRLKKKLEDMKKKDWVPVKNELVRA